MFWSVVLGCCGVWLIVGCSGVTFIIGVIFIIGVVFVGGAIGISGSDGGSSIGVMLIVALFGMVSSGWIGRLSVAFRVFVASFVSVLIT